MHKKKLKEIAYFLGKSLGVVGLLYVFYTLSKEYTFSSFLTQFSLLLDSLPLLALLNFASILLGIYAWHLMLLHYASRPFPYIASYYYFSKTEISKYLPGNVFHFIGRQALASKLSISQMHMAKISFLLTFLLLSATVISSSLSAVFAVNIPPYILILMLLSTVITLIVIMYIYTSILFFTKIKMITLLALSVTLQGIILGYIMLQQSQNFSVALFFLVVSIYILSWLIGFVTPGASGGLGVREGTFIAITSYLNVDITPEIIIFSILLVRLVNIFMDIVIYLSTLVLEKKMKALTL